ncbi:MAG: hypothetical protein Q9191_002392 [Dirinaria sp. TL-2023a]
MALLQNEDFLIWQLRTSYLTHIKDGIGERLINVDSSVLNDPSFRAAGWSANLADIKRTYSPPIPTAVTSDYFSAPPRSAGFAPPGFNDEEDEGGMVTGKGSADTVAPGPRLKKNRRREQHDEDDSSDLTDESEEEAEGAQRAAQQIKFAKMPFRDRSGSSPLRSSKTIDDVEVIITSPSRRSGDGRLRAGSVGAVEAVKQRARRDTATSSDMSSENELDPSVFKRRQINPSRAAKASNLLAEKYKEDERQTFRNTTETIDEDSAEVSDRSSLSSEFAEAADSESLLDDLRNTFVSSSLEDVQPAINLSLESPKKTRVVPSSTLQALPPPRPISTVQPVSLLGQAIKAKQSTPKNPVDAFARLSGKGVPDPLYIRIYTPFSQSPDKPFDMPLQKTAQDSESGEKPQVSVADAIGLALYRYLEEGLKPSIETQKLNVNRWTLRMIEDGEVDFDFPALSRTRPIIDFTSNNNRGARGRSREKPYDEFALVEASDAQYNENKTLTPKYEPAPSTAADEASRHAPQRPSMGERKDSGSRIAAPGRPFAPAVPKPTVAPVDKPILATAHSTPRMGPPKMLKIHYTNLEAFTQINTIEVTTDTYIAEVLDTVCKRWNLDKGYHLLKVTGTSTVAPVDRTVESIGNRTDLDLVRRRFVGDGTVGLVGSPGSSSPNAPLFLQAETPKRGKRGAPMVHPLAYKQDVLGSTAKYRKYNVTRKQAMTFAPTHQRVLLIDEDYLHILPGESGKGLFDSGAKTTRIPFSKIIGCRQPRRHPKELKLLVFREREQKRYDFEASNATDAAEIVEEINRAIEPYKKQEQSTT